MDGPIFIVGTPRSGTTLIAKILGQHSRIFMPGETHFFDDIYSRRNEFGDPPSSKSIESIINRLKTLYAHYDEPVDQERVSILFENSLIQLENRMSECRSYREILSLFMENQAKQLGKSRWGNNTPRDLFHMDSITNFYPDAKFIVCVRDIRDFLLSYKYKWRATAIEYSQRLKQLYHPVITSLLWKASMQRVLTITEYVPEQNLIIIHYEDLVTQPTYVVQKICNVIEEKFESEMLSVKNNNSSTQGQPEGIFTSSIGRWRTSLGSEEAWIAQCIAGRELEKIGYTCEQLKVNYMKVVYSFLYFPIALARSLYSSRDMRGPLLPYLGRRVAPLLKNLRSS